MKKIYYIIATILLSLAIVNANGENIAIVTTDISYADYAVASVVASKIGASVYLAQGTEVTQDLVNTLKANNINHVYIIGGPAVISENSEQLLKNNGFEVTRIFGMTRYGTAVEAAEFFWAEGSEEVVLVGDKGDHTPYQADFEFSKSVLKASELASNNKIPLLLTPTNSLPLEVEEALTKLGVKKVIIFGGIGKEVLDKLSNLTIEVERKDEKKAEEEIIGKIHGRPIVIAAVANWQDGLATRATPEGVSILVFSANEIPNVVSKVDNITSTRNVSKILVVGKPDLAKQIYDALINAGIGNKTKVILASGNHKEAVEKVVKELKEEIKEIKEKYEEKLGEIRRKLAEKMREFSSECNDILLNIENIENITDNNIVKARINLIKELVNECIKEKDPEKLKLILNDIKDELNKLKWKFNIHSTEVEEETKAKEEIAEKVIGITKSIKGIWKENIERCRELLKKIEEEKRMDIEVLREFKETCVSPILPVPVAPVGERKIPEKESPLSPSTGISESTGTTEVRTEVVITDNGFMPSEIVIKKGTIVTWINKASVQSWPASDVHPTHTVYPGSGIDKCNTPEQEKIFDACRGLNPGESWSFQFNEVGSWGYHDHLRPWFKGIVKVVE